MTLNPAITDSLKREKIKADIIDLARKVLVKPDAGFQFEGINFSNPTPEAATILILLQEICSTHREYSLVNWNGGPALVRTADVDRLSESYRTVNEKANFIIRGGSDASADLAANLPKAKGYEEPEGDTTKE